MSDAPWQRPPSGTTPPPPPPPPPPTLPPGQAGPPGSLPMPAPVAAWPPAEPVTTVQPSGPPERQRSRLVLAVGLLAIVAVVVAGIFAVRQLTGGDEGGAASPEELGQAFLDALEHEDVLGLIDLTLPGERDALRQPLQDLVEELQRLEVLGSDASLSQVAGLDLHVEGGRVDVDPTNVDDIADVTLNGSITADVRGESLPIGDLVRDALGADVDLASLDTTDTTDLALPFAAVRDDGRWYVSLGYTIGELGRLAQYDVPDVPATGIEPTGGATPGDAIDTLLDGIEQLDLSAIIASLNPGEAAALQRYAPLFVDDAQAALDQDRALEWKIRDAEYTVEGSGDRRRASIDALMIEGTFDGEAFTIALADGCWTFSAPSQDVDVDSCELAEDPGAVEEQMGAQGPATAELFAAMSDAFGGAQGDVSRLTVVKTDGQWYVSPVGTLFDGTLVLLRALDRPELDRLIDAVPAAFDEFFGYGGTMTFDDPTFDDPTFDDPPADDVTAETLPVDETIPSASSLPDPAEACYGETTGTEAAACFAELLESGAIEDWAVPAELRFPDCGVADAYWAGYSSLGDEEFFAVVEPARECLRAHAAAGEVEDWELPYWVDKIDCFEGRNWYATFGDQDYDDRFSDCVSQ